MLSMEDWNLLGERSPNALDGDSKDGARVGVKLSFGVDVTLLVLARLWTFEMSDWTLVECEPWSIRGFFAERFSGEPLPGTLSRSPLASMNISKSVSMSGNTESPILKAGLHGRQ